MAKEVQSAGFLQHVARGHRGRLVAKAALNELSGIQGGYLVPQEFGDLLLTTLEENSFVRPRATVVPMGALETLCPTVNSGTAQSAGTSPFFGGVLFSWVGNQGVSLTETEPTFGQLSLKACDLVGVAYVSNQMLADLSPEGERRLIQLFGRAAAWYEEYAWFNGTGAANSQPVGMLNAPCRISVSRAAANQIQSDDVAKMVAKLLPHSWNTSVWACSPTALAEVTKLNNWQPNESPVAVEAGAAGSLMSRPLFATDKLPALGTAGDLVFFDPALYVIGDRLETLIESSPHPLFTTNQTVFRVWRRVDGKPMIDSAVTLADGSSTASPVVVLS